MMKLLKLLLLSLSACIYTLSASAAEIPESFKINGQYINPQCVQQLQTSIAENSNIILHSVVLETCQGSNLAFNGNESQWHDNEAVGFENPESNKSFIYKYEGMISETKHLISHHSDLAIYAITQSELGFDVSRDDFRNVHILSKLAHIGFFHCFQEAEIADNKVIVKKGIYHENKPRSEACDLNESERIEIDISKIKAEEQ